MQNFKIERQILKLLGATIRTFDENQQLICRADQKAFKLKEQIYFFADEQKTNPLFSIKARQVIDVAATYDIFGADGITVIASLQRKGLASVFVRDQWTLLNAMGQQIGEVREDTQTLGLLRRYIDFVALVMPPKYSIHSQSQQVGSFEMNYNPFTLRYVGSYVDGAESALGEALMMAIPNLIAIIEKK